VDGKRRRRQLHAEIDAGSNAIRAAGDALGECGPCTPRSVATAVRNVRTRNSSPPRQPMLSDGGARGASRAVEVAGARA